MRPRTIKVELIAIWTVLLVCGAAPVEARVFAESRPVSQGGQQGRPSPGGVGGRPGQGVGSNRPTRPSPGGPSQGGSGQGRPNPGSGQQPGRPVVRPSPGGGYRPQPGRPVRPRPVGGGYRPQPGRPGGRPPQWGRPPVNRPGYQFRPNDRAYLHRYYRRSLLGINLARRPRFVIGGFFPYGDIGYLTPLPPHVYGYLPPPPPGYQMGYFDGYVVVYDPVSYFIANVVDLLQ